MQKHGKYAEVLSQYLSIKESGRNAYRERLEKTIFDTFINISKDLTDYKVRKIVYSNTLTYLKNALLRTPEDKHHFVFAGYSADMDRITVFCQKYIENPDTQLTEEFIQ